MVYTKVDGQEIIARLDSSKKVTSGQQLQLSLNMDKAHFFDLETEQVIKK